MNIYVWEGDGISAAYHDDGTLVVLAESAEQARELVRATRNALEFASDEWSATWDGKPEALQREPDRVLPLTIPIVVAFNGGGYD